MAKKCIVCLLAVLLLVGGVAVRGDFWGGARELADGEPTNPPATGEPWRVTAGELELQYIADSGELILTNLTTGQAVSSSAGNNGMTYNSDYVRNVVSSLAAVSYTTEEFSAITESYLRNVACDVQPMAAEDGLDLAVSFPEMSFGFTMELRLGEGYLDVAVPEGKIWETGEFYLCSISPLPFLAAGQDSDDGYVFYPDGCGALYRFKNAPIGKASSNTWSIYAAPDSVLDSTLINAPRRWDSCSLPVFGIKRGDVAYLGIVTRGEAESTITLSPSGRLVNLSRIGCNFGYRRATTYTTADGEPVVQVSKQRTGGDRAARYYFLWGDEAQYSAMATAYRKYLLENHRLADAVDSPTVPLSLNLFMGIEKETMLFRSFIPMTTFAQAEKMVGELAAAGVTDAQLNLVGWSKGGYGAFASHFPADSRLGGGSGLTGLLQTVQNRGYTLSVQENYVDVTRKELPAGFSIRRHAAFLENGSLLTDLKEQRYLASAEYLLNSLLPACLKTYARYPGLGVQVERLGATVYASGGETGLSRTGVVESWERLLQQTAETTGYVAATEGNAYCLPYVQRLYDVPTTDSGYLFTDESIPFLQMVLHSYIPYSGQPGNLSSDFAAEKLRWVEYGCVPHFEITWERSGRLKGTDYDFLFTSRYEDWADNLTATAKEFAARLGTVWNQEMREHTRLAAELVRVTYADGTRIYINYADEAAQADGFALPAADYVVVSPEGEVL